MAIKTSLIFTILFFFISGGIVGLAKGETPSDQGGYWCIAKPSASNEELQKNIDFACNNVASCDKIKQGGPCFEPQTLVNRASVAMNIYYKEKGKNYWNCDFSNSALISVRDPSYGNCQYDN